MNGLFALCHFCEQHGPRVLFCTQTRHDHDNYNDNDSDRGKEIERERERGARPGAGGGATAGDTGARREARRDSGELGAGSLSDFHSATSSQNGDETLTVAEAAALAAGLDAQTRDSGRAAGVEGSGSGPMAPSDGEDEPVTPTTPHSPPTLSTTPHARLPTPLVAALSPRTPAVATCPSCAWEPDEAGFVSQDPTSRATFLTTFRPVQSLFRVVQQACLRSLSCEVCPGREGPMLFGDASNGYVFSYTFFLRDCQARGGRRWYSLVLLMSDHLQLISCWRFLVTRVRSLVAELQERAAATDEVTKRDSKPVGLQSRRSGFSVRADQFRTRRNTTMLRTLRAIIRHEHLYEDLHAYLSWVLKGCTTRLFERQIEGPSPLGMVKPPVASPPRPRPSAQALPSPSPLYSSLRAFYAEVEPSHFSLLVYNIAIGNQCIVRGAQLDLVESILLSLTSLLPAGCVSCLVGQPEYQPAYACNFLGLSVEAVVPRDLPPESYVLLDITFKGDEMSEFSTLGLGKEAGECGEEGADGGEMLFVIRTASTAVSQAANTFVREVLAVFASPLDEATVSDCLDVLRERWMVYTKAYFKFSKQVAAPGRHNQSLQARFLRAMGLQPEDVLVLRFWVRACSSALRMKLLTDHAGPGLTCFTDGISAGSGAAAVAAVAAVATSAGHVRPRRRATI